MFTTLHRTKGGAPQLGVYPGRSGPFGVAPDLDEPDDGGGGLDDEEQLGDDQDDDPARKTSGLRRHLRLRPRPEAGQPKENS